MNDLQTILRKKVPMGNLQITELPMAATLRLALLEETYPQHRLSNEEVLALMDDPPYWALCWASGLAMARFLLDHPEWVNNKPVVDFGCGSGVVAIAATLAGAKCVYAIDQDPAALAATAYNAVLNDVEICCLSDFSEVDCGTDAVLLLADVFYDRDNIPLLRQFLREFYTVLIADSRVKPSELNGVRQIHRCYATTIPDLAESEDFNHVRIYQNSKE